MTTARQTYDILDSTIRFVGSHRIAPGQKTIEVTASEAKFFLENGALSLHVPEAEPDPAPSSEPDAQASDPAPARAPTSGKAR